MATIQLAANREMSLDEIVTDALGCYQIANRRRHPQLTNNYIALMGPLQHYLKGFEGTIRWTQHIPKVKLNVSELVTR